MRILYIHIGTAKTGTTTIQNTLFRHRGKLRKMGYRYADFAVNHSDHLNLMFSAHPYDDPNIIAKGFNTLTKCAQKKAQIDAKLQKMLSCPEANVVFSGEKLSSFSIAEVSSLKEYMSKHFEHIRIIAYVRDPIGYANSISQQRLKNSAVLSKLEVKPPLPEYRKKIGPYIDVFGPQNVDIRVFNEAIENEFGIIGDFLEVIGIASMEAENFSLNQKENESLSMESAMIISAVNEVRPLISNKKINKGRCFQDVNKIFRDLPGVKFSLSKEALSDVLLRSKSDLDWLTKNLGRNPFAAECKQLGNNMPEWDKDFLCALGKLIFELHSRNQSSMRKTEQTDE